MTTRIAIGIPTYDGTCRLELAVAIAAMTAHPERLYADAVRPFGVRPSQGGYTHCNLWCDALNARSNGLTHLLYVHTDVAIKTPLWLDRMYDMMEAASCEVLFACVPLKDNSGNYNCGINKIGRTVNQMRQLSVEDIRTLPNPFHAGHIDKTGQSYLLLGGGLFLIDMRRPWVEHLDWVCLGGKWKDADTGLWTPYFFSEDYRESERMAEMGIPVYGTKAIQLDHFGQAAHSSEGPKWR